MIVEAFGALTHLGDYPIALAIASIAWLVLPRDRGGSVIASVAIAIVLVTLLKNLLAVPRPAGAGIGGYSFPSGHASVSMALYLSLARSVDLGPRRLRLASGVGIALLVAVSRVVIGVHRPVDVVVGALLGIWIAFGCEFLERRRLRVPEVASDLHHE